MFRTDNPEADAQRHIAWLESQPVEMVKCNYCNDEIELSEAIITYFKGKFTGYACECCNEEIKRDL